MRATLQSEVIENMEHLQEEVGTLLAKLRMSRF